MPPVRTQTKSKTFETTSLVLSLSAFKFGEDSSSVQKCSRGRSALDRRMEKVKHVDLALQSQSQLSKYRSVEIDPVFEGDDIYFPTSEAERVLFKTKEGKVHLFAVLR